MRLLILLVLFVLVLPVTANANEITVRPFLIDKALVPRESVTETIVLKNAYPTRVATLYATVNEISVDTSGEIKEFVTPVMTDRTNTVTSWIEITHARLQVQPGETLEVPLTIKVHPYAEPGEYHLFIGFVETNKRSVAEAKALAGEADGVIVKVTVADERKDSMRISSMTVDRFVTDTDNQQVAITVENAGDTTSAPVGELIFYNNRGKEVNSVSINSENSQVGPGETKTFVASIPFSGDIGRFKANVNLAYGENQRANLYDTSSFYMIPFKYLAMVAGLAVLLLVVLLLLLRRSMLLLPASESGDEVPLFVRDGHNPNPKHHDIDLS